MEECMKCPAYAKCIWNYGGSACIAVRRSYGVEVMTNADRIRAMSDEDLAAEIMCPYDMEAGMCTKPSDCLSCCLEWLRQPVQPTPDAPDTHEHSGLLED